MLRLNAEKESMEMFVRALRDAGDFAVLLASAAHRR
jgi:hypothetical protein